MFGYVREGEGVLLFDWKDSFVFAEFWSLSVACGRIIVYHVEGEKNGAVN